MSQTELEGGLGFLLNDVSRLMRQRFDERARGLGLTRAQWRVLRHLRRYEGVNQGSLAEILEVETVTLGRHIDRLEDSGWVERRRDPSDRRVWRLHLAEKSRPMIDRLTTLSSEVREFALSGLSTLDRDQLIETLQTIKNNLATMNQSAGNQSAGNQSAGNQSAGNHTIGTDARSAAVGTATTSKAKKANVR